MLIIGHRGSAGYRPEHTLAAYELGARMGADYVEPDLVSTKDHVLVARHEPNITDTTDVADHPEFAGRKTTKTIDGMAQTGWFTDDFTLAELRTLRAKERLPDARQRNTIYNGRYQVPTFQEIIDLVKRLSRELHRNIGIYPETKHPTYFRSEGLPLEGLLVRTLNRNGLNRPGAKVFVRSFEVANLKALNKVLRVPIVQLLDSPDLKPGDVLAAGGSLTYGDMATAQGLKDIAKYADGVGPFKDYIIPRDAAGHSLAPTSFVHDAHAAVSSSTRHVPQREPVPAARGSLERRRGPQRVRQRVRRGPAVLRGRRRRHLHRQPRYRGRRAQRGRILMSGARLARPRGRLGTR